MIKVQLPGKRGQVVTHFDPRHIQSRGPAVRWLQTIRVSGAGGTGKFFTGTRLLSETDPENVGFGVPPQVFCAKHPTSEGF